VRIEHFIAHGAAGLIAEALLLVASDGSILDANDEALGRYGYERDELLTRSLTDLEAPSAGGAATDLQHAAQSGAVERTVHARSDGSSFPVEIRATAVHLDGESAFLAAVREIAATTPAEPDLRRSDERLRAVIDNSREGVLLLGPDGSIVWLNEAMARMHRYTVDEMLAMDLATLDTPEAAALAPSRLRRAFEGEPLWFETEHHCKDGGTIPLEVTTRLVVLGGEKYVVAYHRDITRRVRAAAALKDREQWLNESQRIARLGHFVYDLAADHWDGSPALYDVLGIDESSDRDFAAWLGIVHPDDRRRMREYVVHDVLRERKPFDLECRIVTPAGSEERWVHASGKVDYHEDGKPAAVYGTIQDITERHRLENALERRLVALTQPPAAPDGLTFSDLFDVEEIQAIQDAFSDATGVASIITGPDGTPITRPSNYSRLCLDIIQKTEEGQRRCFESDASIACHECAGPVVRECLSAGLWDAGASISAGGTHVANWLIGQVRTEDQRVEEFLPVADEIGADRDEFLSALLEIPVMTAEQFERIATALYLFARELSVIGYQNVQQARFITEQQRVESDMLVLNEDLAHRAEERTVLLDRLSGMVTSVIDVVDNVSEMRDPYTAGHQRRVAELAVAIARELGMDETDVDDIRVAGMMHDIGKMAVPAEILSKPTELSETELCLIQAHAEAGYNIIAAARMQGPIAELIHQHHERCDGSGYPRGLTGDELLIGSKVLMVADVVESMMSHRPYRAALGPDVALAEIERGAGTTFDPDVVAACLRIFREQGFSLFEA